MTKLHVYYDQNSEWVIAESEAEAKKIWLKESGIPENEVDDLDFIQVDDNNKHSIYFEDIPEDLTDDEANEWFDQDTNNGWKKLTKTNKEWISELGKGWIGSSECF